MYKCINMYSIYSIINLLVKSINQTIRPVYDHITQVRSTTTFRKLMKELSKSFK